MEGLTGGFLIDEQGAPEVVIDSAPTSCRNLCGPVRVSFLAVAAGAEPDDPAFRHSERPDWISLAFLGAGIGCYAFNHAPMPS